MAHDHVQPEHTPPATAPHDTQTAVTTPAKGQQTPEQQSDQRGPLASKAADYQAAAPQNVRYLTEPEEARERLKASVDALTQQASLQMQLQKEPLKMLGGASAVGAVLGLVMGRQFRKTKTVYVDAGSPVKHQRNLIKAQQKQTQNIGGALAATLGTLAFKTLMDKVISPRLEDLANGLLDKAGQPQTAETRRQPNSAQPSPLAQLLTPTSTGAAAPAPSAPTSAATPISTGGVSSFVKPAHPGVVPLPESHVEAKAQGTPIAETEKVNPNVR